jgi:hypothetical protein
MFNRRFLYASLASALAILFHTDALAQIEDRTEALKEINALRKELNEKEKHFLSPSAEDLAKFGEFLKQPETGLIRLFPLGLYKDRLAIHNGGSSYSFSQAPISSPDIMLFSTQSSEFEPPPVGLFGNGPDPNSLFKDRPFYDSRLPSISPHSEGREPNPYRRENFRPPSITTYYFEALFHDGLIVMLGKVPLENVTLEHKGVNFLAAFGPPSTKAEAGQASRRDNNTFRKKRAQVLVNRTYALRSIHLDGSGVLAAFRVVRKEIDGSVVILWKTLKQIQAPSLQQ